MCGKQYEVGEIIKKLFIKYKLKTREFLHAPILFTRNTPGKKS